jgi:transposase-like protein
MNRRPRRNHTPAFKATVAIAAIQGDRTLAQLAEQFDVHPNRLMTRHHALAVSAKIPLPNSSALSSPGSIASSWDWLLLPVFVYHCSG